MSGFAHTLKTVFGKKTRAAKFNEAQARLLAALSDYPATPVPFPGVPVKLTRDQAEANFAAFDSSRPARLRHLQGLLASCGVAYPVELTEQAARPSIEAIHRWAGETWPALGALIEGDARERWRAGERDKECAVFSVVTDTATLLGEVIVQARPTLCWGVDLDADNCRDNMPSAHRTVLLAPWLGNRDEVKPVDVEYVVVNRLLRPLDTSERFENNWIKLLDEARSGAFEGLGVIDPA